MLFGERSTQAASDLVIRVSIIALAILTGTGVAFGLWSQLEHTAAPGLLATSVGALCLGAGLLAIAVRSLGARLFLLTAAAALAVAFFAGSGAFSALAS
jgi:hypothetical protein